MSISVLCAQVHRCCPSDHRQPASPTRHSDDAVAIDHSPVSRVSCESEAGDSASLRTPHCVQISPPFLHAVIAHRSVVIVAWKQRPPHTHDIPHSPAPACVCVNAGTGSPEAGELPRATPSQVKPTTPQCLSPKGKPQRGGSPPVWEMGIHAVALTSPSGQG